MKSDAGNLTTIWTHSSFGYYRAKKDISGLH